MPILVSDHSFSMCQTFVLSRTKYSLQNIYFDMQLRDNNLSEDFKIYNIIAFRYVDEEYTTALICWANFILI